MLDNRLDNEPSAANDTDITVVENSVFSDTRQSINSAIEDTNSQLSTIESEVTSTENLGTDKDAQVKKTNAVKTLLSWLIIVIAAIFIAWGVRTFLLTPYEIPSGSMEHTLEINDRVFAEKVSYMFGAPEVGDIVTFTDPETEHKKVKRTLIKRVIATEGHTVDLRDGYVYVDDVKQDQEYIVGSSYPLPQQMDGVDIEYPYVVPENSVWVMGDNRENSLDSRYFGAVSIDTIYGHAILTYWPLDRVHILES